MNRIVAQQNQQQQPTCVSALSACACVRVHEIGENAQRMSKNDSKSGCAMQQNKMKTDAASAASVFAFFTPSYLYAQVYEGFRFYDDYFFGYMKHHTPPCKRQPIPERF